MKRVVINDDETINLKNLDEDVAIFAKEKGTGKLMGLVVNERQQGKDGWIIRVGGGCGVAGHHNTREACLKTGQEFCDYYIEE